MRKQARPQTFRKDGFTLIEIITVLAVLSVLTTLSMIGFNGNGGLLGLLDSNNIDEAKALLNSAAADCLQKSRLSDVASRDTIDNEILSDLKLNKIGYKIDSDANTCSYLQLSPTNEEDDLRYPIGFSVSDGKLSKFANPTSSDAGSISSCQSWAGVNCKQDESLKELIAWKNKIQEEKQKCENTYNNYIQTKTLPSGPANTSARWNTNADSGCPSRPPKDGSTSYKSSTTCTPNGCNRTVYGLDGEFVGFTKEEYDKALEAKYGKLCKEWVTEKELIKYTNDPLDQPQQKVECGATNEFWFYKGKDYGTKQNFDDAIRGEKIQTCQTSLDNKVAESNSGSFDGEYTPSPGGPGVCSETVWLCKGKTLKSAESYKDSSCETPPEPPPAPEPPPPEPGSGGCPPGKKMRNEEFCSVNQASMWCDCI